MAAPAPQTSERFCALNADLTILSSDGVVFKVHRRNLEVHSDIFADAANATSTPSGNDEPVELSESSAVLELLFQYMYRQPQPDLKLVDFPVFAGLAEAAAKYVVYSALPAVTGRMKEYISQYPLHVLEYAAKHDYTELGNEAARSCILEHPLNVLDYAAKYHLNDLANEAARLSISLPISTAASILAPPTFTNWINFYDTFHANARKVLATLFKELCIPFIFSHEMLIMVIPDDERPLDPTAMALSLVSCVHDPSAWYKVRRELENELATPHAIGRVAIDILKFLDDEFMPKS